MRERVLALLRRCQKRDRQQPPSRGSRVGMRVSLLELRARVTHAGDGDPKTSLQATPRFTNESAAVEGPFPRFAARLSCGAGADRLVSAAVRKPEPVDTLIRRLLDHSRVRVHVTTRADTCRKAARPARYPCPVRSSASSVCLASAKPRVPSPRQASRRSSTTHVSRERKNDRHPAYDHTQPELVEPKTSRDRGTRQPPETD